VGDEYDSSAFLVPSPLTRAALWIETDADAGHVVEVRRKLARPTTGGSHRFDQRLAQRRENPCQVSRAAVFGQGWPFIRTKNWREAKGRMFQKSGVHDGLHALKLNNNVRHRKQNRERNRLMKKRTTIVTSLSMLGVILLAAGTAAFATDDEKSAREAAAQFYKALNVMFTGGLDPMKEIWSHSDDVTYMGPGGGFRVGWKQVLKDWEAQADMKLGGRVEPVDMQVIVGNDLAIVQNYEKGENKAQDGKAVTVSIRATNIFRKEKGEWKMISHHTDLLPHLNK
jgi:ketosteroid isomerase-like protein